ncbi:MAG: twin-arginine translocase subunit TatC [Actinobacteria bacterium]|nr:twin-arginine translocase subunit TatC [Actinomycetota bacterium]
MPLPRLPRRLRHGEEAALVDHLGELRARLVVSLGAIAVGFVFAYIFHERLIDWLARPLPPERRHDLVTLGVTEPFFTAIKVSFYAAFALALPVILWQVWSFLAPAVEKNAQRIVATFVGLATVLFAGGLAFAYWIALPKAVTFLTNFDEELYDVQIRASYYYSFAALTIVALAVVFELPIFILALVRLRVLTSAKLRRNRRIGYPAVVALAVILPTVDPVSLLLEAVPLLLLFEGSIWASVLLEKRWHRTGAPEPTGSQAA